MTWLIADFKVRVRGLKEYLYCELDDESGIEIWDGIQIIGGAYLCALKAPESVILALSERLYVFPFEDENARFNALTAPELNAFLTELTRRGFDIPAFMDAFPLWPDVSMFDVLAYLGTHYRTIIKDAEGNYSANGDLMQHSPEIIARLHSLIDA